MMLKGKVTPSTALRDNPGLAWGTAMRKVAGGAARHFVCASAGNHAQGVAYAAKAYGCKAVIVMPTTTPLMKVNRTKGYGAEVVLYGDVYDEACAKAYELAEEYGYTFIHPFDDEFVIAGQATIGLELLESLPDLVARIAGSKSALKREDEDV